MTADVRTRDVTNMLAATIQAGSEKSALRQKRQQYQDDFEALDCNKITALSDKELAAWQATFEQDTPQWRFAEHAWQIRLLKSEIKAMQAAAESAANRGLLGALLGACIGFIGAVASAWAAVYFSKH